MEKESRELRVKPQPPPPEKQKVVLKLPAPTVQDLNSYCAAFADIYGVTADQDFIVNEILTTFFQSDHTFAAYRKSAGTAPVPSAAKTHPGGAGQ